MTQLVRQKSTGRLYVVYRETPGEIFVHSILENANKIIKKDDVERIKEASDAPGLPEILENDF
jgi:hypothetical protein